MNNTTSEKLENVIDNIHNIMDNLEEISQNDYIRKNKIVYEIAKAFRNSKLNFPEIIYKTSIFDEDLDNDKKNIHIDNLEEILDDLIQDIQELKIELINNEAFNNEKTLLNGIKYIFSPIRNEDIEKTEIEKNEKCLDIRLGSISYIKDDKDDDLCKTPFEKVYLRLYEIGYLNNANGETDSYCTIMTKTFYKKLLASNLLQELVGFGYEKYNIIGMTNYDTEFIEIMVNTENFIITIEAVEQNLYDYFCNGHDGWDAFMWNS